MERNLLITERNPTRTREQKSVYKKTILARWMKNFWSSKIK